MAKLAIFNGEIIVTDLKDLQYNDLYNRLQLLMIKSFIENAIKNYLLSESIPIEFRGYLLSVEAKVKNVTQELMTCEQIHLWLFDIINSIKLRESLYAHWRNNNHTNKLSLVLLQLNMRINSEQFISQFKIVVDDAFNILKNQLEIEYILSAVLAAIFLYHNNAILSIAEIRQQQQDELIHLIHQAKKPTEALVFLYQSIMRIDQHHTVNSLKANCPYFHSRSRLAAQLDKVAHNAQKILHYPLSSLEQQVNLAIQYYLSEDWFYHNRKRQLRAQELLAQLRSDNLLCKPEDALQKNIKCAPQLMSISIKSMKILAKLIFSQNIIALSAADLLFTLNPSKSN